ncbi:CeGAL family transcription factor [Aspergillus melleus]|uniref:CeGAL family transcription factor n=1 Tax=Aspergillus melleus TaxID=138277 RepID=UPI001E8EB357|nr:uncharacterized protein LDX57_008910 [Aspergillus melleus]KAH8431248.1 hypothetical protein LDX57_008910 [Aspergillus melleus]
MNPTSDAAVPTPTGAIRTDSRRKASGTIAKRATAQQCSLSHPCKACVSMGFDCTFFQPQKKRGPTGHRVSQIRQQQTHLPAKSPRPQTDPQSFPAPAFPYPPEAPLPQGEQLGAVPPMQEAAPWHMSAEPHHLPVDLAPAHAPPSIATGWGADASSVDSRSNSGISWNERNDVEYWLPDNLDGQMPIFDFPGSNIYLKTSLPSIIQTESADPARIPQPVEASNLPVSSVGAPHAESSGLKTIWPPSIVEANMIPWIDVYFDRLHPTLPVLNRSSLFVRMLSQEHRRNPQFGSMLLSLCAFSLTQPIEIDERPTSQSRAGQARLMMNEATKMRSCSDFGEHPTIEAVLTSFFLFGCLFGSNQHNAAWLRLREALDLAATLGLNNPDSYRELSSEEKGQRLRTYLVLSITERAYALQRRHPITFWGKPGFSMRSVHDFIHSATHSLVSGIIVHNEKDAKGMMGLARLMELFDAVDEDVVDCWNRRCSINAGYCDRLTEAKALAIHQNLSRVSESERYKGYDWFERSKSASGGSRGAYPAMGLRETQCADVFITKKWLQNRVWVLCSAHGLLKPTSDHEELCFTSMEAHGIGLVEKLYDIAISAIGVSPNARSPGGDGFVLGPAVENASGSGVSSTNLTGSMSQSPRAAPLSHSLAEDFLLLLGSLRGGNHPFLEKYKTFLGTSHTDDKSNASWTPQ